ncbi:MAG: ABC transporter substrate-binding protein [Methylobacteriaceae bacterium]|nr:ABC transporter substrate-binding protein [Methylobacteriaceae bacterium]
MTFRRCALVALFAALAGFAEAAPRRVVSANLCADQLLLALAEPAQIVSLSALAADPTLSPVADQARAYPLNRGVAEELVRLDADLVLIGAHDAPFTRALLAEKKLPIYALPPWRSLAEGRAQIRDLAERLGQTARGEALISEIDAALARARGAAGRPATFLTLHRRGYVPGARTVTTEIAEAAGLRDVSADLGLAAGGFAPLERVIAARPDFLLVSDLDAEAADQGKALLWHPALAALYPPERRLVSADPLTLCAGPATPRAIDALAAEIRARTR